MNRDDIIRMADDAGLTYDAVYTDLWRGHMCNLIRFAALVAAAEREECAALCDGIDRRYINQADKCAVAIRTKGDE